MFPSDFDAYEEVKRGRAWGAVVFSRNFSQALSNRVDYGTNVDNFSLDASEVEIRLDMSSKSPKSYDDQFLIELLKTLIFFSIAFSQINKLANCYTVICNLVS